MTAPLVRLVDEDFLSKETRGSPVWAEIEARLQKMLLKKRIDNDNPKLDRDATLVLRGHVEFLKAFLALGKEPPVRVATAARPTTRPDLGAKYG